MSKAYEPMPRHLARRLVLAEILNALGITGVLYLVGRLLER